MSQRIFMKARILELFFQESVKKNLQVKKRSCIRWNESMSKRHVYVGKKKVFGELRVWNECRLEHVSGERVYRIAVCSSGKWEYCLVLKNAAQGVSWTRDHLPHIKSNPILFGFSSLLSIKNVGLFLPDLLIQQEAKET